MLKALIQRNDCSKFDGRFPVDYICQLGECVPDVEEDRENRWKN